MGKLKDAHIFSNEKGSIAKFFVWMAFFVVASFSGEVISYVFMKEPFDWWGILLLYFCVAAVVTVIYFITRLLAYRTKIFPKTKHREAIHSVSFFLLLILALVLLFAFI